MNKKDLAKVAIGSIGMLYVGASVADPENMDSHEEHADAASEILNNIPLTFTEEFNLLTEDGDNLITQDGDRITVTRKVSYQVDLKRRPEIAIISAIFPKEKT